VISKNRLIIGFAIGFGILPFLIINFLFSLLKILVPLIAFIEFAIMLEKKYKNDLIATIYALPMLFFGIIFMASLSYLREASMLLLLLIIFGGIIADVSALYIGKRFGKNKFFPKISPNKTREGAVGSLVITALFFMFIAVILETLDISGIFKNSFGTNMIPLGFIVPLFGTTGDLVESWFKRKCGVKDSSTIFGDHGGFLDRIDSQSFSIIASATYIIFLTNYTSFLK